MKVTTERIPEAQLVLEVEIDDERVEQSLNDAARRLTQRYRIPGFRKGKAPRAVVERALGADVVFEEAIDRLIPQAYEQVIKDEAIAAIGPPSVESVDRDPLRFRARVPLEPEIDLGPYTEIDLVQEPVAITDEDVEAAVLEVRRRHAVIEPVDRPVELNDRLKADVRAQVGGVTALDEKAAEFHVREGMILGVPGVGEKLVGLTTGEHAFSIDATADFDDEGVAGKTVDFTIMIHEIKNEILPDPDDDLAIEVGGVETFQALRERLQTDLRTAAEQRAKQTHSEALLAAVMDGASIEFPPMLAEHEVERMFQELARQAGQDPAAILESTGASAQQLRQNLAQEAHGRVRSTLLLNALAAAEDVGVSDADIDEELSNIGGDGPQADQVRAMFDNENGRSMLRRNLLTTRTLDRLSEIAAANHLRESRGAQAGADGANKDEAEVEADAAAEAGDTSAPSADGPQDESPD